MLPTTSEYSLLAGAAYQSNKAPVNFSPLPDGWVRGAATYKRDTSTGFEAETFINFEKKEIVVAFAGTNFEFEKAADFGWANIPLGVGLPSPQASQAATYYKNIEADFSALISSGYRVSFTGHSLGGGLAALMAVWFNKPATVFDDAPFYAATTSPLLLAFVQAALQLRGYSDSAFDELCTAVATASGAEVAGPRRSSIASYAISGEVLSLLGVHYLRVGQSATTFLQTDSTRLSSTDLHSIALLQAIEVCSGFADALQRNPGFASYLFRTGQYGSSPLDPIPHVLTQLVKSQVRGGEGLNFLTTDLNAIANASIGAADKALLRLALADKYASQAHNEQFSQSFVQIPPGSTLNSLLSSASGLSIANITEGLKRGLVALSDSDQLAVKAYLLGENALSPELLQVVLDGTLSSADDVGISVGLQHQPTPNQAPPGYLAYRFDYVVKWLREGGATPPAYLLTPTGKVFFGAVPEGADTDSADIIYGSTQGGAINAGNGGDTVYGFEGLDRINGGAGDDGLHGGGGDDLLDGGTGADTLAGGADNDTYVVDHAGDITTEEVDAGFDTVEVYAGALSNGTYVLQANIEKAILVEDVGSGGLTGNSEDNVLFGNAAGNALSGGFGEDQLYGNDGNDTLVGADDAERDLLAGGAGLDTYVAGNNDVILDSDSRGFVEFAGERLKGGRFTGKVGNSDVYIDALTGTTYYHDTSTRTLAVVQQGKTLTISNFRKLEIPSEAFVYQGMGLGIELRGKPAEPEDPLRQAVETGMQVGQAARVVWRDPLLVDLNGDGQISTVPEGSGVRFDFDDNGFAESGGWAAPSDGLVVRDLNGNGTIDSGRELFGDQTLMANGTFASNGFQAIAALDSNSDGKVDSADAAWGELRVWRDANNDGRTDSGELLSMAEAGVSSIGTGYTNTNQTDPAGNILAQLGSFVRADGSIGKAGSFLFDRDPTDSIATELLPESAAIQALPELDAFGNVHSLRQAMARSTSLEAAVGTLVASTDYKTLRAQFDALVQQWAGAAAVSPTSRGANMDARQLAVLEAFYGQSFVGVDGANPNTVAAPVLKDAYIKLVDGLYAQFLAQAQLKPVWGAVQFAVNETTALVEADFSTAPAAMQALLGVQPSAAVQLLYDFAKSAKQFGLDTSAGFAGFKATFEGSEFGYDKVIQAGLDGLPLVIGTDAAETLTMPARGVLFTLNGGGTATGTSAADVLVGGLGNDTLNGSDGDDLLSGGAGNDVLDGGRGADTLRGGAGDDVLGGSAGGVDAGYFYYGVYYSPLAGNVYEGGTGSDTLRGTSMADVYLFNLGDGQDTIHEVEVSGQPGGQVDVLRFGTGITTTDIGVGRNDTDLVLSHVNGTDRVTMKNWFTSPGSTANQVERVEFADGTTWSNIDLTAQALVVTGTAGNDTLNGVGSFNDTLRGEAGNDALNGGEGNDVLEGGDGNDVLDGGRGADTLRGGAGDDILGGSAGGLDAGYFYYGVYYSPLAGNVYEGGIGSDTLRGTSMADTYLFNLGDGQDTIYEVEVSGQPGGQVDVLRFGSGIAPTDISVGRDGVDLVLSHVNGADRVTVKTWFTSPGSSANQVERVEFADGTTWSNIDLSAMALVVTGTAGNDTLNGVGAFNDTLRGEAGNDTLNGGDGNDVLEGGDGNDVLDGGRGADTLRGGAGDDLLGGSAGGPDVGYFYYGIYYSPLAGNVYEGGIGNDTLRGTSMADTYLFNLGDGQDTIYEVEVSGQPSGQVDVLRFGAGIAPSDIAVGRNGTDLVLSHLNGTDRVTVKNWFTSPGSNANQVERVEFADGTTWSNIDLSAMALVVTGTAGNDTLNGVGAFNDTLRGEAGNDTLNGGDGNDVLEGGDGNDVLDGGRGADTLRGGAGDDILGGVWNGADAGYFSSGMYYSPLAGNTYEGGVGNDTLRGTSMADVYLFNLGDGQDTIHEVEVSGQPSGQVDVLRFGAGIAPSDIAVGRNGTDLVLSHLNGTDRVTVKNWFTNPGSTANQVERVEFANGTTWTNIDLTAQALVVTGTASNDTLNGVGSFNDTLRGEDGNDTLNGGDGNDVLEGGDGNDVLDGGRGADTLRGGAGDDILGGIWSSLDGGYYAAPGGGNTYEGGRGNDTLNGTSMADLYLFNLGDGQDRLYEVGSTWGSNALGDTIRFGAGVNMSDIQVQRVGFELLLTNVSNNDSVTIMNWFRGADMQIEKVELADGTSWTAAQLVSMSTPTTGTANNDTLTATSNLASTLYGQAGNDTLNGGSMADLLYGGTGNDALNGGAGSDDYRYFNGDGFDTIQDAAGAADVLRMDGLNMSTVQFWRVGDDLSIEVGSGAGVLVKNQFASGGANQLETFYMNGSAIGANSMALLAQPKP